MENNDFTSGPILPKLLRFMLPVLFAMFLQAMYGAVDLLIVGRFCDNAAVSAISTGSQIVMTLTNLIVSFSMGITVAVGKSIGQKRAEDAANIIGTGLVMFAVGGVIFTLGSVFFAEALARLMQAPEEAFALTADYIKICGAGFLVITAYNLLGSIFRGLGDSKTPLLAVGIACICNIAGDLLFVAGFGLGAAGAALATVMAQFVSVAISLLIIRRVKLPFRFGRENIRFHKAYASLLFRIGTPIALQDFLVGVSFLGMLAIVNNISLEASAGVGVAEKVCAFIMLVPAAFMQSMSAFVAQNYGAGKIGRAKQTLKTGIAVSFVFGVLMFLLTFFRGDLLAGVFSGDANAVANAWDYLKAYAIDCLLTCFLFCFIGYYNGLQKTTFVMIQGVCGAFCVRLPLSFLLRSVGGGSLFLIGLATPASTILQIILCFAVYARYSRGIKDAGREVHDGV